MPYPFAHPAAVLPLPRLMGRLAVPSALVIGSIVPDLWYFVPSATRMTSHGAAGLFLFCLPAGLALYLLFHLLLKQPLIALLSPALGRFTPGGLPAAPWHAVVASLLAGALTHVAWDDVVHLEEHRWAQHASTALGSAILALWLWRKQALVPVIRAALLVVIFLAAWIAAAAFPVPADLEGLRRLLRGAGPPAFACLAGATLVYCLHWKLAVRLKK